MKLGIFDLVEPSFGLGLFTSTVPATGLGALPNVPAAVTSTVPATIRDLLSALSVEELHMAYDDAAIVYYGKVQVGGDGLAENTPTYRAPSGNLIELNDISFQFRITFPRLGSASLLTDFNNLFNSLDTAKKADFGDLRTVLNLLGGTTGSQSDFPTKNLRIELLFNSLILHLPRNTFLPARLAADGWLERDPSFDDVTIHLPKIAMTITQNNDDYNQTSVTFDGWGVSSMDDQTDLAAGELISMRPSLCLHSSSVVGFGLEKVVLDLSTDFTPPEIIEKNFGVGDEFKGLWMPEVRFFLAPSGVRGMAFDTWGKDILIDFDQGLSGEIGVELLNNTNRAPIEVDVVVFEGIVRKTPTKNGADNEDSNHNITRNSFVYTTTNAEIQLRIRGGRPPYTATITRNGATITGIPFAGDANRLRYPLNAPNPGNHQVSIRVEDSLTPTHRFWQENLLALCIDAAAATGNNTTQVQPPQLQMLSGAPAFLIQKANTQPDNDAVYITTNPINATVTVGGSTIPQSPDGTYHIPVVRNGTHVAVTATWPTSSPGHFIEFFPLQNIPPQLASHGENLEYLQMIFDHPGANEDLNTVAANFHNNEEVRRRFEGFLQRRGSRQVRLYGYASYERHDDIQHVQHNVELSDRRAKVLQKLLILISSEVSPFIVYNHNEDFGSYDYQLGTEGAKGAEVAKRNSPPSGPGDDNYHVAIAVYETSLQPAAPNTATAEVWRDADTNSTPPSPANPTPPPTEPERPSAFRRIGARVRFQRNQLVFAELFGKFDVIDEARRNGTMIQSSSADNGSGTSGIDNTTVNTPAGASAAASAPGGNTPENQGVIDFKISMLYDTATRKLTQTLAIGFDRNNARDGFVHLNKFNPEPLANTMASLLLFAPLIQGGIEAVQNAQTDAQRAEAIAIAGAEIGVATLLGLFAIKMEKITLFDVEFTFSEISPDIWLWNAQQLTDIGVLLDYAVDFKVNLNLFNVLTIQTKDNDPATGRRLLPPRARYKAIGFNFHVDPATRAVSYQPIFDTSKGYELSLGDPGALEVRVGGVSLNNLLRILSARLSRENPLTFEADLALNVNLGIVSIDQVRVRLRIYTENDPVNVVPEIIPTRVGVNIPGALTGTGYLDFGNSSGSGSIPGMTGGFQGYVDITVVPVKLRIAASVGIKPINEAGREATAFFLGLEVELPAGIPLGGTGLGIFGFLGLFAMHYKRLEQQPVTGQLPPALKWFYETVHGNVIDVTGWGPSLDKWSFGVGVILGTMEGGFVLNLKGMFMLELPGPRILIFVKASLLFPKPPSVRAAGNNQSVGILAVIDLDFNIGRLTIGLILEYNIESVLSLRVPVVSQFIFNQPEKWFLDIGSNVMPAEALILGIVRGYAYLMIHGDGIENWPRQGDPQRLFGFSLALGLGASIVFGDRSSGLYLEVRGDFAAGVSFAPLHFYGFLELRGQLHLWVVSISAWANLEVEGPNPHTYIHGRACGRVSCLFFDIEGCVEIEINNAISLQPPPDLLTSLTLVSRSSALMAGQGVDRPIDGALGKAAVKNVDVIDDTLLTVPIDSIPVVNLFATPAVKKADLVNDVPSSDTFTACSTFTDPIPLSGTYTQDGWISVSAKTFVRYRLRSVTLNKGLADNSKPKPVQFWKKTTDNSTDNESSVDMALLCWMPEPTPRAVQRSQDLTTTITSKWETICKQVAPATSVFYTFNQKPLGYSPQGWKLYGAAWPDAPGTIRSRPADTDIFVFENQFPVDLPGMQEAWAALRRSILDHAKVIGGTVAQKSSERPIGRVLQFPFEAQTNTQQEQNTEISDANKQAILAFEAENILVDCGKIVGAEVLLALPEKVVLPNNLIIRTLDKDYQVLNEKSAEDYGFTLINAFTDLPTSWQDGTGPWQRDALAVWLFLLTFGNTKKNLQKILVHFKGSDNMRYMQIVVRRDRQFPDAPSLLLCAMEMFAAAEFEREQHDTTVKQSDNGAIDNALQGEPLRALLKPNTRYELTINYDYQRKNDEGLIDNNFVAASPKTFVFQTDAKAPIRLDPWILTSTPQNDMRYHFKDDPVQIYLNDESVIQLYKVYNINLEAKVLKANGQHPVVDPAKMKLNLNNSLVQKVPGAIKTPFLHTLDEIMGTELPCRAGSGSTTNHVVFTIGVALLRNTEYTVEIVKEGETIDVGSNAYRTPLYKIAFRTSRYSSAAEFALMIGQAYSNTRLLKAHLQALPAECTDKDMEAKLLAAGMPAIKPADNIAVSFLWSSIISGGTVVNTLEAILIDTPEPLWRKRPYPNVETVTSESGEMKHWVMADRPEMELVEAPDSSVVINISHTQGGARTLVYLKSTAPGNQICLQLKKHTFTHVIEEYNTAGHFQVFDVLNIQLPTVAPWAEED